MKSGLILRFLLCTLAAVPSLADSTTCSNALVSPKPKGLHCEERGDVANPSILQQTSSRSLAGCRDICLADKKCISYTYRPGNKNCRLLSEKLAAQGYRASPQGPIAANRHCYACQCSSGLSKCDGNQCVDLTTSSANCGTCGHDCGTNAHCFNSQCYCDTEPRADNGDCCAQDMPNCGGACTDISKDDNNCGACGQPCDHGKTCQNGACACTTGQLNDDNNCGTCGQKCSATETCQSGSCASIVPLSSRVPITNVDSNGVSQERYDDEYFIVDIPFPVAIYDYVSTRLYVSVNGWVGLTPVYGGVNGSNTIVDTPLPEKPQDEYFSDVALPIFMSDQVIVVGYNDGIYLQIDGVEPTRTLTVEWQTEELETAHPFHYEVQFAENLLNTAVFRYNIVDGNKNVPIIGAQRYSVGAGITYDETSTPVVDGTTLALNVAGGTKSGTFVRTG